MQQKQTPQETNAGSQKELQETRAPQPRKRGAPTLRWEPVGPPKRFAGWAMDREIRALRGGGAQGFVANWARRPARLGREGAVSWQAKAWVKLRAALGIGSEMDQKVGK